MIRRLPESCPYPGKRSKRGAASRADARRVRISTTFEVQIAGTIFKLPAHEEPRRSKNSAAAVGHGTPQKSAEAGVFEGQAILAKGLGRLQQIRR